MRAVPLLSSLLLIALAGCPAKQPAAPPPPPPPRLVVLVVVDQLPAWAFPAKAAASTDGFARLMRDGRQLAASYPYAATQTAPGHAALGTGAPPSVTGILGNEWWDREAGREIKAAEDPGGGPSSAARLRVDGIADVLLREHPEARAVAVALKDRSAILSLGHAGLPVWYDAGCVCFVGNREDAAPWLDELATASPIAPRLAEPWLPLAGVDLAKLSGGPDDAPGELAIPGWDATFPHVLGDAPDPARALIDTPLGNQIVVEAALAALAGEGLGADDVADLLVVSFSAHDYVGHAFGPDSWEAWDTWLRLDQQLGALLRGLDDAVGAGRWSLVLTGDHGAPGLPERHGAGQPVRRFTYEAIGEVAERAAAGVAGDGDWIASAQYPTIYLSEAARRLPGDRRDAVIEAVVAAVGAIDGLQRADRSDRLLGDCDQRTGDDRAICLSLDAERSGEIFFAPAAGTILHGADWVDAISHGSLQPYDREVPLILFGPDVDATVAPGLVSPLQVAPTLAAWLGVPAPPAAREPRLPLR